MNRRGGRKECSVIATRTPLPHQVASMEEIPGKLLMAGFEGTHVTSQAVKLIEEHRVGSFILGSKNFETGSQTRQLITDLQRLALRTGYVKPLLIVIDQEGGMCNSLYDVTSITQFPGAMALAASGSSMLVYEVGKAMAQELRSLGFNMIMGPVLDVVSKMSNQLLGVRCFSSSVPETITYGEHAARGLRDGGLLVVGKHFPGIGSSFVDHILELPMISENVQQLESFNILPFQALIEKDLLDGIHAGGCAVPNISPDEIHACLSPVVLNGLLREKLHFRGAVLSECLELDALYQNVGLGQGVVMAISAGCDIVLVCHDLNFQEEALASLRKAVVNPDYSEMLQTAFSRVNTLLDRIGDWETIFKAISITDLPKHQTLAAEAYRKSITLIRDNGNCLPLSKWFTSPKQKLLLLTPLLKPIHPDLHNAAEESTDFFSGEEIFQCLGRQLSQETSQKVLHTSYTANGITNQHETLIQSSKAVILVVGNASRNMFQIGFAKHVSILCLGNNVPLVIVSVSSPYDFLFSNQIGSAYLCTYDYTEQALEFLAKVLFGKLKPTGHIPGENLGTRRTATVAPPSKRHKGVSRRWLVEELELKRDWSNLATLLLNNPATGFDPFDTHSLTQLCLLLQEESQKHFVVRNSSLNLLYGVCLTWFDERSQRGSFLFLLVDHSKRGQSIGQSLQSSALRYLAAKAGEITLGSSFPLVTVPTRKTCFTKDFSFFKNQGWSPCEFQPVYMMRLDLEKWSVPKELARELKVLGVCFDICSDLHKIVHLVTKHCLGNQQLCSLYEQAAKNPAGVTVLKAIEPSGRSIVGSIVLFSGKSSLSKYFPCIDGNSVGALTGLFVEPSYENLVEAFKLGLICTAISYCRKQESWTNCVLNGVDARQMPSLIKSGFVEWRCYSPSYGKWDKK